ncbi:hypothetical protein [Sanguibacter sp. Z1732]|uniref:hypothetical protein n=1 Tax=Sanguibacter sp. Z1732 TaxID=3435412 RepID=UPI003D9CBAAF
MYAAETDKLPTPSRRSFFLLAAGAAGGLGLAASAGAARADILEAARGGIRSIGTYDPAASRTGLDFTTREAFEAVEDHLDGGPPLDVDNYAGMLGWQSSYVLQAQLQMYLAHRDVHFLDRFIERADAILAMRDSELGRTDYRGLSLNGWPRVWSGFTEPVHTPVETGMIARPMAWFARVVLQTPMLASDQRFRNRAEVYAEASIDALDIHEEQWGELPNGGGIYSFTKGSPYPYDGIECAYNMNHTLGSTALHLAALTGEPSYADKVRRMCRLLESDLDSAPGGAYTWSYQWSGSWGYRGWSPEDEVSENTPEHQPGNTRPEDFSHGALSMEFVAQAQQDGIAFTGRDVRAFAHTFNNAIVETDYGLDVTRFIDGTGEIRAEGRDASAAGAWACLYRHNRAIIPVTQTLYDQFAFTTNPARTSTMLCGISQLNRAAALGRPHPGGPFPPRP